MNKGWYFVGGFIGAGILAYMLFKDFDYSKQFEITFSGHYLKFNLFNPAELEIYLKIKNKLPVDLTINGYSFDIYINDNLVKNVNSTQKQTLVSGKETQVVISTTFSPIKLAKGVFSRETIKNIISNPTKNYVAIKGMLNLNAVGFDFQNIQVDSKISLSDFINQPE